MSAGALPLLLLSEFDGAFGTVALVFGWAFAIWGVGLYWVAAGLYLTLPGVPFVYYGEDGLDELTTTGPSFIYRLLHGEITHAEFTPEDFGVPRASLEQLRGGDVATNVAITRSILEGETGPKRDIALVNAAPAIVVAGLAEGFVDAMALARQSIDSGDARAVLEEAVAFSTRRR